MAGKNLKVALQVQADLNQAKREIGSLKDTIQDTTKAADAATASQGKTSKAVAITADEIKKLSGATNLKDGIKQVSDFETGLNKSAQASRNMADSNKLIEKSITSLTPHLTALVGLSGGFIAVAVDTLNKAAELQNLSSVTGMNVEEFQYSAAAAKKVGIEVDNLSQIFQDARDKVGDYLAEGGGELQQFFDEIAPKVGVTAKQFEKLNGDQILQLYVKTLQEAGVSQNEMVTHMERMASDSTRLIPIYENNAAALRKYGDAAKESGAILSQELVDNAKKAKSALGDFQMGVEGVTNKMVANAAPAIVFVAENMDVLVRAGLILASLYAGKMVTATMATTLAFIKQRAELIATEVNMLRTAGVADYTANKLKALATTSKLLTLTSGLPGLAIAAAGVAASFLLMPTSAEAATDSLDDQGKSVADLAEEYKKLNAESKQITLNKLTEQLAEQENAVKDAGSAMETYLEQKMQSIIGTSGAAQKALEQYFNEVKAGGDTAKTAFDRLRDTKLLNENELSKVAKLGQEFTNTSDKAALTQVKIDVLNGKTANFANMSDAAAEAAKGMSGGFDTVGTHADGAATKIQGITKAYKELIQAAQGENFNLQYEISQRESGVSPELAAANAKSLAALNADPSATQTYFRVPDEISNANAELIQGKKEIADLDEAEKKRQEAITKEKERQVKISEQTAKINKTVLAQSKQYNYAGKEQAEGIPNGLLYAISTQESRGNANATSPKGAKGAFQFMPATAQRFGLSDRTDVNASADAATKYLGILWKQFNGDLDKVIMAYNAGEGNVASGKAYGFKETQNYLVAVKKNLAAINGLNDENAQANLSKMIAAESEYQKQQQEQQQNRINLREFYYTDEEKALAEHNKRISDLNKAGYSSTELKSLLEKENQRYEDVLSKRPEILKRVQDSLSTLNESFLRSSDNGLQADLNGVDEKWKQTKADLASLMMSEADPLQANQYQEMLVKVDFVIDKEKLTLQFNDAMKQLDDLQSLRSQRQENLKYKFDSGQISRPQYAEGLQNIDSDITPKMQGLIDMARELALQMGDAFSVEKLDSLEAGLNKVDASLKQFLPTADQLNERIAGGLTDAIMDWADGTKSAGDAFKQFASDFLREIAQMILKQMLFNAISQAGAAGSGGLGGAFASIVGAAFSTGGWTGPGSKYQPAGLVHADEFVIRKESTSQAGAKEFLSYFNHYGMDALNKFKGYATGGMVGAPNILVPNIQAPKLNDPVAQIASSTSFSANQNFYLVDDPARILDVLKSGASQENLVVMMSRDPAKFKSALKLG